MKKFLAMILALVMVLAMVSVASAEDAMRVAMTPTTAIHRPVLQQTTYEAARRLTRTTASSSLLQARRR